MYGEQLFPISALDRMRGNELTLKHEGFRLNMKKNFLEVGVVDSGMSNHGV